MVRNIVYILDGNKFRINVVEIVNQRTMASRTEQQLAGFGAERLIVHIHRNCVGGFVLIGKGNVVINSVSSFK